ncbi:MULTISPECIES: DNA double-strand break repair nuclease NurA [Metallosphaera]|uniref:DNA double-strand break repair nuclease NurA n=1 Tax=Metallosphaera TaxID=41980 RepID=UPI001F05A12C|nr:DNA double-strand break repair nuclease NurA [Metallosphaera sedula]MCH1770645.1 DNA double-strand break repair nuclease NurA [Metallosphaera sedula]MCP6728843.1 DNA double-strand break repair nuclease NurA [Metallosphaera sedula]
MASRGGLSDLLNSIVSKYIIFHLESPPFSPILDQAQDVDLTSSDDIIRVVDSIPKVSTEIVAVDGSSRSFVLSQGLISVSSVSAISSLRGIKGMFPSFDPSMSLDLQEPFIALATPFTGPEKIEDFLLHPAVSRVQMEGNPFQQDLTRLETELRFSLETSSLEKVKDSPLVLVDGPLLPKFLYINKRVANKLLQRRKEVLQKNFIGIVKRVNHSTVLIESLNERKIREVMIMKYKVNPASFSNDEAFLIHLVKKNFKPPFKPLVVGPLHGKEEGTEIFSNYVVIPFHPFLERFSVLRVESLTDSLDPGIILSTPITSDGIPLPLAFADKVAKEVSNAVFNMLLQQLSREGIQSSFYSRLEGLGA